MMTSNRSLEDCRKLIGDVSTVTSILDRLLQNANVIQTTGQSYRLRGRTGKAKESSGRFENAPHTCELMPYRQNDGRQKNVGQTTAEESERNVFVVPMNGTNNYYQSS